MRALKIIAESYGGAIKRIENERERIKILEKRKKIVLKEEYSSIIEEIRLINGNIKIDINIAHDCLEYLDEFDKDMEKMSKEYGGKQNGS